MDTNPTTPSSGTIQGKITNVTGDTVIINANVSTNPPTSSVSTNSNGEYTINDVPPGMYIVKATKGEYNPGTVSVSVTAGKTTTANILMSIQTVNILPTQGLVAYYPFNGNANDESGNGNNGINNGATLTADRFGNSNKAYSFNGINNYIRVNNRPILNFGASIDFSINCWIKGSIQNFPDNWFIGLVTKAEVGFNVKGYQLGIAFGKITTELYTSDGDVRGPTLIGTSNVTNNNWHLLSIVVTRNPGNFKLFVNGIQEFNYDDNKLSATLNNNIDLLIGVDRLLERYFKGSIDDIRIYNRALSKTEIQALYNER